MASVPSSSEYQQYSTRWKVPISWLPQIFCLRKSNKSGSKTLPSKCTRLTQCKSSAAVRAFVPELPPCYVFLSAVERRLLVQGTEFWPGCTQSLSKRCRLTIYSNSLECSRHFSKKSSVWHRPTGISCMKSMGISHFLKRVAYPRTSSSSALRSLK